MNKLIYFLVLALLVVSCGNTGSSRSSKRKVNPITPKSNPGPSKSGNFKISYQFVLNGCDTGKHDFAASSREELDNQYCEALQDNKRNNNCAIELRELQFEMMNCRGVFSAI